MVSEYYLYEPFQQGGSTETPVQRSLVNGKNMSPACGSVQHA